MSAIRDYLKAKVALGPNEWLRREPRDTHPEILAAVRKITASAPPDRTLYDDQVEQYVNDYAGDLPRHLHHGHADRHPLVIQLGHEVYIARKIVTDEENAVRLADLHAEGFVPFADWHCHEGDRCIVRFGTLYSGYSVPVYGKPHEVRVKVFGGKLALLPKGARSRGFDPLAASSVLVRPL